MTTARSTSTKVCRKLTKHQSGWRTSSKRGEAILQEAREKQAQILKEAAETRDAIVQKAQEKAKSEGARLLSEAKAEIEGEKQQAIRDIRAQVAELSVQIAEKVLRQKLSSDAEQMQMIDRLLDDVTAAK